MGLHTNLLGASVVVTTSVDILKGMVVGVDTFINHGYPDMMLVVEDQDGVLHQRIMGNKVRVKVIRARSWRPLPEDHL